MDTSEIYWIAGLLEGEGCFNVRPNRPHGPKVWPCITLCMTDHDVINRAHRIMKVTSRIYSKDMKKYAPGKNWKTQYFFNIVGSKAAQWMMTLYTLMGSRRQTKIKDCLTAWKSC